MSNPFTRRRLKTSITVSSHQAVENEVNQKIRDKEERIKEGEEFLFESIYGQNEILERMNDLTSHPIFCQKYETPISGKVPSDPVPLAQLHYNEKFYEFGNPPPLSARPKLKRPNLPIINHETLENLKNQPMNRLIIPLTSNIAERQKSARPANPKLYQPKAQAYTSQRNRSRSVDKSSLNSIQLPQVSMGARLNRVYSSVSCISTAGEIINGLYPLYLFDDTSYDIEIMPIIIERLKNGPVKGYCRYTFDNDSLEWRECSIVSYDPPNFTIYWDDPTKTKEIYRISLRFDFEDPDRFEERRELAFQWREYVEKEARLDTFLRRTHADGRKFVDTESIQHILKLVPEDKRVIELTQEIISDQSYAENLAKYIDDCKDRAHVMEFMRRGYAIIDFKPHTAIISGHLTEDKKNLIFPEHEPLIKLVNIIMEMLKIRLYTPVDTVVEYEDFFNTQVKKRNDTLEHFLKTLYPEIIYKTREILVSWDMSNSAVLLKMVDLRIVDVLYDIIYNSFTEFISQMENQKVYLHIFVTKKLELDFPEKDKVKSAGSSYLDLVLHTYDQIKSTSSILDKPGYLPLDIDSLITTYEKVNQRWCEMVDECYDDLYRILGDIKETVSTIPLEEINLVSDLTDSPTDFSILESIIKNSQQKVDEYDLKFEPIMKTHFISIDNTAFHFFIHDQEEKIRKIICESISTKIYSIIDIVNKQLMELKERCQRPPLLIEDWYERHQLLHNLTANFKSITEGLQSTIPLFDFLEIFYYETRVHVSITYYLRCELQRLLDNLPKFFEQEKLDLDRLSEEHGFEKEKLQKAVTSLYQQTVRFHTATDVTLIDEYLKSIVGHRKLYDQYVTQAELLQKRDKMINLEPTEFTSLKKIQFDLDIFQPLWTIAYNLDSQVEEWMSVPFLELDPDEIVHVVKGWEKSLAENKEKFDDIPTFNVGNVEIKIGEHPLLSVFQYYQDRIDDLISHIPIIQHLCNPVLRNRHWLQISDVTGFTINQNEGLTWHWVMESRIEDKISDIANITRSANYEYKIEKSLTDMTDEVRSLSLELKKEGDKVRIQNTTPIFQVLSDHQVRIQEIFVPPYIKPFMMKIKEYDCLATNLRSMLNKTLDAQSKIDDLAPAMESKDIRTQSASITVDYDENVKVFNRLVNRFGDPKQFHELVSNPKYFSIIDDLQDNLVTLKEDLNKVIEEKRKLFPHFRFLSDLQLIHLISYSHQPSKFKNMFSYIYNDIAEVNFENEKVCLGFRSIDGEVVNFQHPYDVTPESIETLFENFDASITNTLSYQIFQLLKTTITNIIKVVENNPTQVSTLSYQILFTNKFQKIIESADIIFSERKASYFEQQFTQYSQQIQQDITYLGEAARTKPTTAISNLVTVLIKQRDIIAEFIAEKATDLSAYAWTRHLRFAAHGDTADSFTISAYSGLNAFAYGFAYTGGAPIQFLTDQNEQIYSSFMTSLNCDYNILVSGGQHLYKTKLITDFARLIGRNVFVYSCSAENTLQMLQNIIETVFLTGYFLVLRDIKLLTPRIISDLAPTVMNFSKKKKKMPISIFATYASTETEALPPTMRFLFRPINLRSPDSENILRAFLYGIGIQDNEVLLQQLVTVVESLAACVDPKLVVNFSCHKLMKTIAERPVDQTDPSLDIYNRLIQQVNNMIFDNDTIKAQLRTIFNVTDRAESKKRHEINIPEELMPTSPQVAQALKFLLEMVNSHNDVIILGDSMTGKSTLIKCASKILQTELTFINPYAQSFSYLSSNKNSGLLYNSIIATESPHWIVFDSQLSDDWMNILSVSMASRSQLYFNDGCCLKIPKTLQFMFETDSFANATPAMLSYCGTLVLQSDAVTWKEILGQFVNKLNNDDRIVEPLSLRMIGTQIKMSKFIEKIKSFMNKFLPLMIQKLPKNMIFTTRHIISNFFNILESILTVHYYCGVKMNVFEQQNLAQMYDDFDQHVVFSSIWSFGAMYLNEDRDEFEEQFKEIIKEMGIEMKGDNSHLFAIYYDTNRREWSRWESIGVTAFYDFSTTITDISPEYITINQNQLISSLYMAQCLISQGRDFMFDSTDSTLTSILMHLGLSIDYVGAHFSPLTCQYPVQLGQQALRDMIDQSIAGIRDGSRSTSRLPLISLLDYPMYQSSITEFLRFVLDQGYMTNLKTFSKDITTGVTFVMTTNLLNNENINQRLLRNLCVIRFQETGDNTILEAISRSISSLTNITKPNEIANIIYNSVQEIESPILFNTQHILKLIQRVAMVMDNQSWTFFPTALSYESVAMFYDYDHKDETLAKLNLMVRDVSKVLNSTPFEPVFDHANVKLLSNILSNKFRPIQSLNEVAQLKVENEPKVGKQVAQVHSQLSLSKSHGRYIENYDLTKVKLPPSDLSIDDQRILLKLTRYITTPRTHILVSTDFPFLVDPIFQHMEKLFGFKHRFFKTGQNLLKAIHDEYVNAGKTQVPHSLIIYEQNLMRNDIELLKAMTLNPDVFGLFGPNEILMIMSELHCSVEDEDPFHEETLESKSNYHLLVRDFFRNCNHFFHLIIMSSEESQSFEFFFEHCSPITMTKPIKSLIRQTSHFTITQKCNFTQDLAATIWMKLQEDPHFENFNKAHTLPILRSITYLFTQLFQHHLKRHEEKYKILKTIADVCKQTEEKLEETLKKQVQMEEEVQRLAQQIEGLMEQTKIASDVALKERQELEAEEQILRAQQMQAEQIRKESEASLATTKPLLQQSAQELRSLSSRDISIIKTMNHPPRGVFLVVKSIVIIMGYKIEDKTDEHSGSQPSWIQGKKLLSDTSFLPQLMKRALENLTPEIMKSLKVFLDDPNFEPSIVANSSTAAKSICQFIRALVPYYNAIHVYDQKQIELKKCQENLGVLQKKHELASQRLNKATMEFEEIDKKSKNLLLNKQLIENQLEQQQANVERNRQAMSLMRNFFDEWGEEMTIMLNKRSSLETRTYFIACCFAMYGAFPVCERDSIFEYVRKIFDDLGIEGVRTRAELVEEMKNDLNISNPWANFGVNPPLHWVENNVLFTISSQRWAFVIDRDCTILTILKPIACKRLVIASCLAPDFQNDLLNAVLGNDLLIIYDYDIEEKRPIFYQLHQNRGTDVGVEIGGSTVKVPADFQLIFLVESCPEQPLFESIFIELYLSDEEIQNTVSNNLFMSLDPDESHKTMSAIQSAKEATSELIKTKSELQQVLIGSAEDLLNDDKVYKQFQNASNIISRLITQVNKLGEIQKASEKHYIGVHDLTEPFVKLYHDSNLRDGIQHFYDDLLAELTESKNLGNDMPQKIEQVLTGMKRRMASNSAATLPFNLRVPVLCKSANIDITTYDETLEAITKYYGEEVLTIPSSIPHIVNQSTNRRPVVIRASYHLFRFISQSDKVVFSPITDCVNGFNTALRDSKMLVTICPTFELFSMILSIISKIRSATSLSQNFRFFIFIDFTPNDFFFPSTMLQFCDLVDINGIADIKRTMSYNISSMPVSVFDPPQASKTNKWRRTVLLLSFFDSSANQMTQCMFQNLSFNEDNFSLMCKYAHDYQSDDIDSLGRFFVSTFYGVEQPEMTENLNQIWKNIFQEANFENINIVLFDKYKLPHIFVPANCLELIAKFPLIDSPDSFAFPPLSDTYYKQYTTKRWTNCKLDQLQFTSIELQPVDTKQVIWYLKSEAGEVNLRFLHHQCRFDRGLRRLLQKLRSPNPVVDISILFDPDRFLRELKHEYLLKHQKEYRKICIMLTVEETDVPIEHLIAVNAECNENGLFQYKQGAHKLPRMYLKVCEIDESYYRTFLFFKGVIIGELYLKPQNVLPTSSIFILAAFTSTPK